MSDNVYIIGVGMIKFGKYLERSIKDLTGEALQIVLKDCGIELKDIEAGWVGTLMGGFGGAILAEALQWDNIPITRVEGNCTSSLDALRNACFSIAAGMYDIVLVTGVEKSKDTGTGQLTFPYGMHPLQVYIQAPAAYGMAGIRYAKKYGISMEDYKLTIAKIAVKNHHNGTLSPKAHFQREVTLEQVVNAPIVGWPHGLFDCCPTTDGATAAIICRADLAKSFRDDYILVKGLGFSVGAKDTYSGKTRGEEFDYTVWPETEEAARQAYEQVGIKDPRKEISIANVHDCFTTTELINYESLGFSPKGRGKEDVDSGFFSLAGELPVNTDGGLKSFGHPIGASALRMVYELYKQLQGKAGPRQIKKPTLGLAHVMGGNPTGGLQTGIAIVGTRD
jgi:acetyl-CoA C-acetyltransferase